MQERDFGREGAFGKLQLCMCRTLRDGERELIGFGLAAGIQRTVQQLSVYQTASAFISCRTIIEQLQHM